MHVCPDCNTSNVLQCYIVRYTGICFHIVGKYNRNTYHLSLQVQPESFNINSIFFFLSL